MAIARARHAIPISTCWPSVAQRRTAGRCDRATRPSGASRGTPQNLPRTIRSHLQLIHTIQPNQLSLKCLRPEWLPSSPYPLIRSVCHSGRRRQVPPWIRTGAKLKIQQHPRALVGSSNILSFQSQVLDPLPPLNYARSGDLHQVPVPASFDNTPTNSRLPFLFPKRSAAGHFGKD
jgi:hypothetical protein